METEVAHIKKDGLIAIVRGPFTVAQMLAVAETLAAAALYLFWPKNVRMSCVKFSLHKKLFSILA